MLHVFTNLESNYLSSKYRMQQNRACASVISHSPSNQTCTFDNRQQHHDESYRACRLSQLNILELCSLLRILSILIHYRVSSLESLPMIVIRSPVAEELFGDECLNISIVSPVYLAEQNCQRFIR